MKHEGLEDFSIKLLVLPTLHRNNTFLFQLRQVRHYEILVVG